MTESLMTRDWLATNSRTVYCVVTASSRLHSPVCCLVGYPTREWTHHCTGTSNSTHGTSMYEGGSNGYQVGGLRAGWCGFDPALT